MLTINLFDTNFIGQACSVANQTSRKIQYVRDQPVWEGISFFTDAQMFNPIPPGVTGPKFGWLHEGMELHPENYERAWSVLDKFDAIFTTEQFLWSAHPKFWPCIRGGTWVPFEKWGLYPKSRNIAMITSEKRQTRGHQLRHELVMRLKQTGDKKVDHFGVYGTKIGTEKEWAYRDYRYAVVIEAQRASNFFSEHLLDALAYGCVPIYWGCPNIGSFFDPLGIIQVDSAEELLESIQTVNQWNWELAYSHRRENLKRLANFAVTEDWMVENVLEPYYGRPL